MDERGTIVNLSGRLDAARFQALSQVDAYWSALAAGGQIPSRSEIDPRGLDRVLRYAFILERVAPGVARFRLAGAHLNDLMGMEVRGMPITAISEPSSRARFSQIIEAVFDRPEVVRLHLSSGRALGRPALDAMLYLAPLTDTGGRVARAIGCLQSEGGIGRAPRRFDIVAATARPAIVAETQSTGYVPASETAFAEDAAPFEDGEVTPRPRPALRVVK